MMARPQNHCQVLDSTVVAEIEARIAQAMAEHQLPGLAIGIVQAGQVCYARGFGVANMDTGKPVTTATLFNVGSLSKSFTAIAIFQLVEQGKIDLDTKAAEILPYFRLEDARYVDITVRHLLSHTSGLPSEPAETTPPWQVYNFENPDRDDAALERFVRSLHDVRLLAGPGGPTLHYSSVGFDILGDIIAKVSGQTYEEYMRKDVLAPLGMEHSTFLPVEAGGVQLAQGHRRDVATGEVTAWPFLPVNRTRSPNGGLFTSVDDLNQAALALLNRGEWRGKRIVTTQSLAAMWSTVTVTNWRDLWQEYGLGWILAGVAGHRFAWHGGSNPGFLATFVLAPDDAIAVSTLVNSCRAQNDDEPWYAIDVGNGVIKRLLGIQES